MTSLAIALLYTLPPLAVGMALVYRAVVLPLATHAANRTASTAPKEGQ